MFVRYDDAQFMIGPRWDDQGIPRCKSRRGYLSDAAAETHVLEELVEGQGSQDRPDGLRALQRPERDPDYNRVPRPDEVSNQVFETKAT